MKERLLNYLACPVCRGDIVLHNATSMDEGHIMEGQLSCNGCSRQFPIVRGVPRFADLESIGEEKAATASSFGWEWKHFTQEDPKYAQQLLGWIDPVKPEFFKDKVVLDAGCGKARHTQLAAAWGARDVIGVDLSDAVESAFAATRELKNAHIVQGDICNLPFKRSFDYAFSLGVLDHLAEPLSGFKEIASKLNPGAGFSVWVYGAENNEWITNFITPLREHFTSRISPRALMHLSKVPTAILYLATKLVYGPLSRWKGRSATRHLFYGDYLTSLSAFGWREQHTIVFDHLVAPTAQYISRERFEEWWNGIGARETVINWHNRNSWRGFGRTA